MNAPGLKAYTITELSPLNFSSCKGVVLTVCIYLVSTGVQGEEVVGHSGLILRGAWRLPAQNQPSFILKI